MRQITAAALAAMALAANAQEIVRTDAYIWHGDTITQGEYMATAPDAYNIVSTYSAQPHYKFPIERTWSLKNDISKYPRLNTPNTLHRAIYNMALDEMVNAVEPDTTLRTGKEWGGVWTRDVSYSILLSMAAMQPEASRISLMKKVTPGGVIIQDTGSGGAWPISSDREIWTIAAYELYKVTGDRQWLQYIYPIIKKSLYDDSLTVATADGLVKGETSFIDWREQSHPRWMQTADIYNSETLSTSVVHAQALHILAEISSELGETADAEKYERQSQTVVDAINRMLWMPEKGYYAMYRYGRDNLILNPRAETLGESLAILYGIADEERARTITASNPTTPFGSAIFFPQIADIPSYHNNALWPWVSSYWAMANAKAGNEQGTLEAIGAIFRPAALFATNKENFNLDNGDIATELNSSNMLWCLAGNIAMTQRILFGIEYCTDGLAFAPFVPKALAADRTLENYRYRNAILDITVRGHGNRIASFKLNGREHAPLLPTDISGHNSVEIVMADNEIAPIGINRTANVKAPLTPIAWLSNNPALDAPGVPANNLLQWNPIEYIGAYAVLRNGQRIDTVRTTSYPAVVPGEYQVIGISGDGVESFASEPRSNMPEVLVEFPAAATTMISPEISYTAADGTVNGFNGNGFVEIDRRSAPITVEADIPATGVYSISLRYANGNGPVNTENKAAIRTLCVDGDRKGVLVMPQRGVANWDDWGISSTVQVMLTKGKHRFTVDFRPENTNMNGNTNHALVDCMVIRQIR